MPFRRRQASTSTRMRLHRPGPARTSYSAGFRVWGLGSCVGVDDQGTARSQEYQDLTPEKAASSVVRFVSVCVMFDVLISCLRPKTSLVLQTREAARNLDLKLGDLFLMIVLLIVTDNIED